MAIHRPTVSDFLQFLEKRNALVAFCVSCQEETQACWDKTNFKLDYPKDWILCAFGWNGRVDWNALNNEWLASQGVK